MRDQIVPKLPKWPFLLGDVLLLGMAGFIYAQSQSPMNHWVTLACAFCVAAGAGLAVLPYLSEYRATVQLAEGRNLVSTISQIRKIEQLASQISGATAQWQNVQESSDKTAKAAKEIASGMAAEMKGFNEFLRQANDSERGALRLEVEKSRRAEGEWLQVIVRVMDHVFALNQAALRSGQSALIEQIGNFHNACRDAVRRVGLVSYIAAPGEAFDAQRHQVVEGEPPSPESGVIGETVATGYTFQGRLIRPALVRVQARQTSGFSVGGEGEVAAAGIDLSQPRR